LGEMGSLFYGANQVGRTIEIPRETTMYIFEKASIINPSLSSNALGLYTMVPVGRDGEAVFGYFGNPRFNLRKRSKRCAFNPSNCGMDFGIEKIPTCPLQLQNKFCVDMLWNTCWQKMLGIGSGIRDWNSTQEAGMMLAKLIDKIMLGVGNDVYDLITYGGHPYIQMANDKKWYKLCGISDEKWECFYEMMMACGGHLTAIDTLKLVEKLPQLNVGFIKKSDTNGSKFVGDAMALFDAVKASAKPVLSQYQKSMSMSEMPTIVGAANPDGKLLMCVTQGIFDRYKEQLRQIYKGIDASYYLTLYGEDHGCGDCGNTRLRGVLEYDGCLIVCKPEWSLLDDYTCVKSHRALLMAPGVLGIAYDVPLTEQRDGMGMSITNWTIDPHRGETFVSADFRIGAAILDHDYIAGDCFFLEPGQTVAA